MPRPKIDLTEDDAWIGAILEPIFLILLVMFVSVLIAALL